MNKTYTEVELDEVIERSVKRQGAQRASVIPILNEINESLGFIPVEALGKIRPSARPVIAALAEAASDPDSAVRMKAVQALGQTPASLSGAVPAFPSPQ